jgi:hypothetical protein
MLGSIASTLPSFVWALSSGVILTIGDVILRSWFQSSTKYGFALALSTYMLGIFFMMMSFFDKNIAVATVAAVVINGVILGICAFGILELS